MAVKVAFLEAAGVPSAPDSAVLIPKSALQNRDGHDLVFTVHNGRAERRAVTVRDTLGDDAVLSAGVTAGEKVIADCPAGLKDGAAVKEKVP